MDTRVGEPLYFGASETALFGCLHRPTATPIRHAALLLPAAAHEYQSGHRSLRQLALRLTERGCLALRMDFRGCGDSLGGKDEGCLEQWCDDAEQGLRLLAAQAPDAALLVVGMRLGASIAAMLGARRPLAAAPLAALALWDPVMEGHAYLAAALDLQQRRHHMQQRVNDAGPFEVLGHRWSATLGAQLRALKVAEIQPSPATNMLLVDTLQSHHEALLAPWRQRGAAFEYRALQAPDLWSGDGQVALIPTGVVQAIAAWLVPS
jgi:alpha-beta hydrolase superfamily lysophospholipase